MATIGTQVVWHGLFLLFYWSSIAWVQCRCSSAPPWCYPPSAPGSRTNCAGVGGSN